MKKIYFLFIAFSFLFVACEENMPTIPCLTCDAAGPDEPTPDLKKVLIEEFTGVSCVNCPDGSAEIENLLSIYPNQLIAISLHAGFYAPPYPNSLYDFRTEEAEALNNFLDTPESYPTATINRKNLEGGNTIQLPSRTTWGGYVAQEIESTAIVNLDVSLEYEESTRKLTANTNITPLEDINGELYISIVIVENNVVDVQSTNDGIIDDYKHKHVFRDMMTYFSGELIEEATLANTPIEKTHSLNLDEGWNTDNVSVVIFVHRSDAQSREVLQAEEVHMQD